MLAINSQLMNRAHMFVLHYIELCSVRATSALVDTQFAHPIQWHSRILTPGHLVCDPLRRYGRWWRWLHTADLAERRAHETRGKYQLHKRGLF